MKSRTTWALSAIAAACAPVTMASATVLFTENFEGGTASTRFDIQQVDADGGVEPGDTYDTAIDYAYDYSTFTWIRTDPNGFGDISGPVPSAPNSTGGTTKGLRLDVNNVDVAGAAETAILNLFPKVSEMAAVPSGDHRLKVDVWVNYNGRQNGGTGSTEYMIAGINQNGTGLGGPVLTGDPGNPGQSFAIDGEGGNGNDYRVYRANTRLESGSEETGYVVAVEGTTFPNNADHSFWQTLYPGPTHETPGTIGKKWVQFEMKYEDDIVYYYIDGTLWAARTDTSASSGRPVVGYADFANSVAALEAGVDANFAIFDNILVETITQSRQKWNNTGGGNWSESGKWDVSIPDANTHVADFTTQLAAPSTVTVDSPRTVRSMTFTSTNGYTIAGSNAITMTSLTTGIFGSLKVNSGSHTVSAPLVLNRPTNINVVNSGSTLTLSNVTANGRLVKLGAGNVALNNVRTPSLTVSAGKVTVIPQANPYDVASEAGTGKVTTLTASAGLIDLTNTKIITQDASIPTTPVYDGVNDIYTYSGVHGLVQKGRGDGSWNGTSGITTSQTDATTGVLTSVAVGTGAELRGLGPTATELFAGQTINGASTVVMYTYGGDADMDGDLDGDDYFYLDSNVLQSETVFGWTKGDFNYDGRLNGDDYFILDSNILQAQASGNVFWVRPPEFGAGGIQAVPEPASIGLLGVGAMGLLRRRRSK